MLNNNPFIPSKPAISIQSANIPTLSIAIYHDYIKETNSFKPAHIIPNNQFIKPKSHNLTFKKSYSTSEAIELWLMLPYAIYQAAKSNFSHNIPPPHNYNKFKSILKLITQNINPPTISSSQINQNLIHEK